MSTLHTINGSPTSALAQQFLAAISSGDAVLFLEDGVYHTQSQFLPAPLPENVKLYGLREDCTARAVLEKVDAKVNLINYADFVALSCEHDRVISWF